MKTPDEWIDALPRPNSGGAWAAAVSGNAKEAEFVHVTRGALKDLIEQVRKAAVDDYRAEVETAVGKPPCEPKPAEGRRRSRPVDERT